MTHISHENENMINKIMIDLLCFATSAASPQDGVWLVCCVMLWVTQWPSLSLICKAKHLNNPIVIGRFFSNNDQIYWIFLFIILLEISGLLLVNRMYFLFIWNHYFTLMSQRCWPATVIIHLNDLWNWVAGLFKQCKRRFL